MINQNISLLLVYEPATADSSPLPLARIEDPRLIHAAAVCAINEAMARANILSQSDELLAEIERSEAERLVKTLSIFIPELREEQKQPVGLMM